MTNTKEEIIASWQNFLDLPVELSVEIGRTNLTIREILNLAPSSIIKLSRSTGEGVDIRADNKSLLRGEIIALEDGSGVRVTEILMEVK